MAVRTKLLNPGAGLTWKSYPHQPDDVLMRSVLPEVLSISGISGTILRCTMLLSGVTYLKHLTPLSTETGLMLIMDIIVFSAGKMTRFFSSR